MQNAKTVPITIRIPTETRQVVRDLCMARGIDTAEYIRQLIDRDLRGKDTIPAHEKRFIERVVEETTVAQTRQLLNFFSRICEKIDKIYYNMGTRYDQAKCKSEELYAIMEKKYAAIGRVCPEDIDTKVKQYTNEFSKSDDWNKTFKIIQDAIDRDVIRYDYLYKAMDYAAEKCKEKGIINIFINNTLHSYGQAFNDHIDKENEKNVNYSDVFEHKIKPIIDRQIEERKAKEIEAHNGLVHYAHLENTKKDTEIKMKETWLRQLRQSTNISETAENIRANIRPKGIISRGIEKFSDMISEETESDKK